MFTKVLSRQEGSSGCSEGGWAAGQGGGLPAVTPALGETGRREAGGLFRRVISPGVLWEREQEPGFSLPLVGTALSQPP